MEFVALLVIFPCSLVNFTFKVDDFGCDLQGISNICVCRRLEDMKLSLADI